jgi:hypothetical protein
LANSELPPAVSRQPQMRVQTPAQAYLEAREA